MTLHSPCCINGGGHGVKKISIFNDKEELWSEVIRSKYKGWSGEGLRGRSAHQILPFGGKT